jgi:hypothetical protein
VGLPGFEPGSKAPEASSLDQTSRQPLFCLHCSFLGLENKCCSSRLNPYVEAAGTAFGLFAGF